MKDQTPGFRVYESVMKDQLGKGDSTLRVWMSRGYVEWDEIAGKYINKKSRVS